MQRAEVARPAENMKSWWSKLVSREGEKSDSRARRLLRAVGEVGRNSQVKAD